MPNIKVLHHAYKTRLLSKVGAAASLLERAPSDRGPKSTCYDSHEDREREGELDLERDLLPMLPLKS
jgi:hypothetical protein